MKKRVFLLAIPIIFLVLVGCTAIQNYFSGGEPDEEGISYIPIEEIPIGELPEEEQMPEVIEEPEEIEEVIEEPEEIEEIVIPDEPVSGLPRIMVNETDLVSLQLPDEDVDGDPIEYDFSDPLDEMGEWQTELGDAGEHIVTVTASDGKSTTVQQIIIDVKSLNKAPVLEFIDDITVIEGETITIKPNVVDPDGDDVTISYSGFMNSATYKTRFTDAGQHTVTVYVTDGMNDVSQDITITVGNVNRPPILQAINDVAITEGELVRIDPVAADPDGDDVTLSFSDPLDEEGEWQTEIGDSGKFRITVSASDDELTVEKKFFIIVESLNQAPEINSIELSCGGTAITCDEFTVNLDSPDSEARLTLVVDAEDPDEDDLTTTFSGWMTSSRKTIEYGEEGGSHEVTITVSDGTSEVSEDITIEVNSAPCIVGFTC